MSSHGRGEPITGFESEFLLGVVDALAEAGVRGIDIVSSASDDAFDALLLVGRLHAPSIHEFNFASGRELCANLVGFSYHACQSEGWTDTTLFLRSRPKAVLLDRLSSGAAFYREIAQAWLAEFPSTLRMIPGGTR